MWKLLALATVSLLAASCAVSFTQVRAPDGRLAYVMNCNGIDVSRRDCARLAYRLCPRGYHLVDERSVASSSSAARYRNVLGQGGYVMVSCN
jgi:hypothetical protein